MSKADMDRLVNCFLTRERLEELRCKLLRTAPGWFSQDDLDYMIEATENHLKEVKAQHG